MKEEYIRPQKLFDELLKLLKDDIKIYFENANYKNINCPACNNNGSFLFHKDGFNLNECHKCKTIFVNPIPDRDSLNAYYSSSKSTEFWANSFYKATEKNRREKLWKPKAKLISDKIDEFIPEINSIIDIGGGYGIFMEEFLKIKKIEYLIIEPSNALSEILKGKKLNVLCKFLEDVNAEDIKMNGKKVFTSFELFEHLLEPKLFLQQLYNIMGRGDLFIFTTLSGMGIDIQVLQENSKAISPPMHLNFFNPKSIKILLEKVGFKLIEITTPGKLDIDILQNNKDKIKDKFWKNFLEYSSDNEKQNMQDFIVDNNLSSHMMIIAKKE